ncbi:MAG: hypothetical protein HXX08_23185 [Chloroflexi bacterium]|uniref:Uncharacterized protein n=1 Tax=Candidatus Chlorohelix allophototropha TaxID=3003348 RepID=A0A8T7M9W1_9CHLR|nr:hypothetical protein [Chloroflexota bacterium]WJW68710.1 hypothetical protein OZ401_004326 [Chloroflexota bacterium L227-S17]
MLNYANIIAGKARLAQAGNLMECATHRGRVEPRLYQREPHPFAPIPNPRVCANPHEGAFPQ